MRKVSILLFSIGLGIFFSCLNSLMVFKQGSGAPIMTTAPIFGYLLLRFLSRKYTVEDNVFLLSVTSGACFTMFTLDAVTASIVIFSPQKINLLSSPYLLMALSLFAALSGIAFILLLKNNWLNNSQFPFPYSKIAATLIDSLKKNKVKAGKALFISFGGSAFWSIVLKGMPFLEDLTRGGMITFLPKFIGFELSPLLIGIGMIFELKTTFLMFFGAVFSSLIWVFFEKGDVTCSFFSHVTHPMTLSMGTALIITSALGSFYKIILALIKTGRTNPHSQKSSLNYRWMGMILLMFFIGVILFNGLLIKDVQRSLLLLTVTMILGFVSTLIISNITAEIGFVSASSIIYIALGLISLITKDFNLIMILAGVIGVLSFSASAMLGNLKLGQYLEIPARRIIIGQVFGVIIGGIVGPLFIIGLDHIYGFNNQALPVPISISWGVIAKSISLGSFSSYLNPYLFIAGVFCALLLIRSGISPTAVGIAVLLPPSITITILAGGLLVRLIKPKGTPEIEDASNPVIQYISSGLIAGEGLITLIFIFLRTM